MSKYKFGTTKDADYIIYYCGESADTVTMETWCKDGPYGDVNIYVPGVVMEDDEIFLHHDNFLNREYADALIEYLAENSRPVTFGPFNTKSCIIKLKADWKDLCVCMEG